MDLVKKKKTIRVACLVTPAIWYNWSICQILGGILSSVWQSLRLCLHKTGELLRRHKDNSGRGFCSHIRTVIWRAFCNGARLHRADLLKWRVTYQIGVHTIQENFFCRHKKLSGLVWSQPKFLSLFIGPFPADRPRISNSAKKIKNFSTEDKKILGKSRAIFRTCMYNQTRCVESEMSSYLGKH